MEKIICLDTSILIDYYRKKDKSKSAFFHLTQKYHLFAVSIITEYEILVGSNSEQELFWRDFFDRVTILPFNDKVNKAAIKITKQLRVSFEVGSRLLRDSFGTGLELLRYWFGRGSTGFQRRFDVSSMVLRQVFDFLRHSFGKLRGCPERLWSNPR